MLPPSHGEKEEGDALLGGDQMEVEGGGRISSPRKRSSHRGKNGYTEQAQSPDDDGTSAAGPPPRATIGLMEGRLLKKIVEEWLAAFDEGGDGEMLSAFTRDSSPRSP